MATPGDHSPGVMAQMTGLNGASAAIADLASSGKGDDFEGEDGELFGL